MTMDVVRSSADTKAIEATEQKPLPAWPIMFALWGYGAWWALGLLPFSAAILCLPMLVLLIRRRGLFLVPGALPGIAFVLWMLPCAIMLDSFGRMIGFGMRFSQFAAIALTLVYIINAKELLTPERLLRGLTAVWVTVIVGGYLGMLWPEARLTYTIGRLLPGSILANEYVSDLVFPPLAEIQDPWGAEEPFMRPSAPYAYTNGWGATMAILTPIVVGYALHLGSRRSRMWLLVGVAAAIPPAVATTNRGLFLTLGLCIGYVVIRLAFRQQWRPFVLAVAGSTVALAAFAQFGLLDGIAERQDTVDTTEGRGNLYAETFARTLGSPILGYGAPRPSFTSEITAGTQGMVWNAMFCFGFVGLFLFAVFLLGCALRTWSAPSTPILWMQSSLVGACAMGFYYGMDRQLLFVAVIAGLLLRERYDLRSGFWRPDSVARHAS